MGELQRELRGVIPYQGKSRVAFLCHKAADELDRLTAENARLRAKLELTPENVERVKADIRTHFASDMTAGIVATAAIKALGADQ
jgi:hypothetical protein